MSPLLAVFGLLSVLRVPGPLTPRTASYAIEAKLDDAKHALVAEQVLTWRNDGSAPVAELPFHLYMNAFKNDASTFFSETTHRPSQKRWGFIDVTDVKARRTGATWAAAKWLIPPVGDQTLARLQLDHAVQPGETIEVSLRFVTHLPEIVARTGYHEGFYAGTQWFPKIAVYRCTPTCGFVADVHHWNSEFFADFGTYDVRLDVPRDLVIGATGVLVDEVTEGNRRLVHFRAEDVHDFAFAADARFVPHELDVFDDAALPPVHVVLLGETSLAANAPRHLEAVRVGLAELGRRLGAYPYRQLTVVQVPPGAEEAGGMEYPTLFFTDDERASAGMLVPELVTAHELAHQWLQGMVASDEVNDAWLDEGLTELATSWVLARLRPPVALVYDVLGHHLTYRESERRRMGAEGDDPVAQPAYAFRDAHAYAQNTYRKTSLLLQTIAERIGAPAFEAAFRRYADTQRWKHPLGADLLAAFDPHIPQELSELLSGSLQAPGSLDFTVAAVETKPVHATEGWVDRDGVATEVRDPPASGLHRSTITITRRGSPKLSATLRAQFTDGTFVDRVVHPDSSARLWQRVEVESKSALVEATLHPADDTPLDVWRWNDGLRVTADYAPRRTVVSSAQLIMALLLSWVTR